MAVSGLAVAANKAIRLLGVIRRPEFLVFLPAITLSGYWLGGEQALVLLALGLPLLLAVTGTAPPVDVPPEAEDSSTALARVLAGLDRVLPQLAETGRGTACLVVQFDDLDTLLDHHGRAAQSEVLARMADRLRGALRVGDTVTALQGGTFLITLAPVRRLDLENMVQMCARLQEAIADPVSIGGARIYVTCSIGFCIAGRSAELTGRSLIDAAQAAADEALRQGPGAVRAFSADMERRRAQRDALRDSLELALDRGEIRPHFQPQISTDTGEISGFEALARWYHPERGCLTPGDFLPAVESADLFDRLGEVMLFHALSALCEWDRAGLRVPSVAVNFSASELRNPRLPERIRWELDRFDLKPDRLTVEILETVVAQSENDVISGNIAQLSAMGCGVDLDDFGTGHASIATLRRFRVRRLKIDRSYVTRVDQDREQQRMVSAIISLADRLGLQTLAEGVETAGEHAMLSQLGCGHVQGFGLARPMALEDATQWIARHAARPERIPKIGLRGK